MASACTGDPTLTDAFDPATQWQGYATDTADGLGSHTADCGGPERETAVINEFSANIVGTDVEYIEVYGDPNTDFADLTVLQVEGDSNSAALGTVVTSHQVGTTDADGFWLVDTGGRLQNGTLTLLLVSGYAGTTVVDTDRNGVLDDGLGFTVVDSVAVNDGGSADLTYSETVLVSGYDGINQTPGGASRIPDGVDTDTVTDWVRNDFDGAGLPNYPGTITAGEAYHTPGKTNAAYEGEPPPPPGGRCGDPATPIGTVQGTGATSPLSGQSATVEGVVVGDFQTGGINGYFVQDAGEGEGASSDGIFVYAAGGADVSAGDRVRVSGTVSEYNGQTQLTLSTLLDCGDGVLPEPLALSLPVTDREPYEGMYVIFPQNLAILEYYNYGRYGEIMLGYGQDTFRQYQPTAVFEPYTDEAEALRAFNRAHRILLDDGLTAQNPAYLRHPDGTQLTLDNTFRGGDTVTDVTGVLAYQFNAWRVQPTEGADHTATNPRPEVPDVGGNIQVASFNVLNYFTTLGERGADTAEEFERQEAKIVAALVKMDAEIVGLVEIENNGTAVDTLVEALNEEAGAGTYAYIDTGVVGTDAITTAFIYQPAEVTPVGDFATLTSEDDPRFLDTYNRPALAQTFADNDTGGTVTVVANHFKSKGSGCDLAGDPADEWAGNCNGVRTDAAEALADWLETDPTGAGSDNVLIIGDLNAYDKEDPIRALLEDGYTDLLHGYQGEDEYSYVFDGMLGYLDYALANGALLAEVTGAATWKINADEPSVLDYDMTYKPPAQDQLYAADPYRSSDHDPVIVGLTLLESVSPTLEVITEPSYIWPANGKWRTVNTVVLADDDSGQVTVTLVGATATGGGRIEVVSDTRFRVLAVAGAQYTITYEATDAAGNTTVDSVTVAVDKPGKGEPSKPGKPGDPDQPGKPGKPGKDEPGS